MNYINGGKFKDKCKEKLLVPNSDLDSCQNLFMAADKKCEKASTIFQGHRTYGITVST